MDKKEELVVIQGREVVLSYEPVRMYTETGEEIGLGTLDEVIARQAWCRSVHAWMINKKGELYLSQRSMKLMNNPGKWSESCGGYVSGTHSDDETLQEETREELGLIISPEQFRKIGEIKQVEERFDGKVSRQFVSVYFIEHDFLETEISLDRRDVLQGRVVHWKTFAQELERRMIDFVDHPEELTLVLSELAKSY